MLCELTKTYFVKLIKLSCEVNHVVLCSNNYSTNDFPYSKLCLLIVRLQLYRKLCMFVIPFLASHIDTSVLADGTYELIPESEEGDQEAQRTRPY